MNAILTYMRGIRVYLYAGLAATAMTTGAWYMGQWKGHSDEKTAQAAVRAEEIIKGVKAYAKANKEVRQLTDPDLDAEFGKWMRD